MSDNNDPNDWNYDTSIYSASKWGFDEQVVDAKKALAEQEQKREAERLERKETREQQLAREKAEEEKKKREQARRERMEEARKVASAKMRAQAEERRQAALERLAQKRIEEDEAARKAAEEEKRLAAEEKRREEEERERQRLEEEARRKAEAKFNSPKQLSDILTIPAPTKRDKEWLASQNDSLRKTVNRHFLPSGIQYSRTRGYQKPESVWQLNHLIKHDPEAMEYISNLFYDAVTSDNPDYLAVLDHYNLDVSTNHNSVLRIAFRNGNKEAFDKLVELGASAEMAMEHRRYKLFDKIQFARFAGLDISSWEKQSDQKIMHKSYETDGDDVLTVRTFYDFEKRKIKTVTLLENDSACACMESFSQQDTDFEIDRAFEKLNELGGSPTPPSGIIKRSSKTRGMAHPIPKAP